MVVGIILGGLFAYGIFVLGGKENGILKDANSLVQKNNQEIVNVIRKER